MIETVVTLPRESQNCLRIRRTRVQQLLQTPAALKESSSFIDPPVFLPEISPRTQRHHVKVSELHARYSSSPWAYLGTICRVVASPPLPSGHHVWIPLP